MYVRANGTDALAKAENIFGNVSTITKNDAPENEVAFVTEKMPYGEFSEKSKVLENDGVKILSSIRIGDL